jgi:hypothetical protein
MIRETHVARQRRPGAGPDQVSTEHVGVSRDATGGAFGLDPDGRNVEAVRHGEAGRSSPG